MSARRALVVDDSKSARAFLSRILERHEFAVDAAESAEAALEYLARNKPDIIFMDHMMPGMDGFQAVQTIKNNPRTSAIPILMYTSQEGDLYLGQARALGAEGVLPKQIKQSDVTKMLYQLRLVADRRGDEQTTFARMAPAMGNGAELLPANESAIVVTPAPAAVAADAANPPGEGAEFLKLLPQMSLEIRAALDVSLQKELIALRGFIASTLDSQSERIEGHLAAAQPQAPQARTLDLPTMLPERRSWSARIMWTIIGWSLATLAVIGAAVMSSMWWQQGGMIAALRTDLDAAYAEVEALRARPPVVSVAPSPPVVPDASSPAALSPAELQMVGAPDATLDASGAAPVHGATEGATVASPASTAPQVGPSTPVTSPDPAPIPAPPTASQAQ
jgi:CheY-like chemotaxis protein